MVQGSRRYQRSLVISVVLRRCCFADVQRSLCFNRSGGDAAVGLGDQQAACWSRVRLSDAEPAYSQNGDLSRMVGASLNLPVRATAHEGPLLVVAAVTHDVEARRSSDGVEVVTGVL